MFDESYLFHKNQSMLFQLITHMSVPQKREAMYAHDSIETRVSKPWIGVQMLDITEIEIVHRRYLRRLDRLHANRLTVPRSEYSTCMHNASTRADTAQTDPTYCSKHCASAGETGSAAADDAAAMTSSPASTAHLSCICQNRQINLQFFAMEMYAKSTPNELRPAPQALGHSPLALSIPRHGMPMTTISG